MFYLLEMGMILALPALSPLFLSDVNGAADNIAVVLLLIILSFTTLGGWIWILRKSKKAWLITIPILIWVTIGSVLTFATLCMSV